MITVAHLSVMKSNSRLNTSHRLKAKALPLDIDQPVSGFTNDNTPVSCTKIGLHSNDFRIQKRQCSSRKQQELTHDLM